MLGVLRSIRPPQDRTFTDSISWPQYFSGPAKLLAARRGEKAELAFATLQEYTFTNLASEEATLAELGKSPREILQHPLTIRLDENSSWNDALIEMRKDDPLWTFWIDWYERWVAGNPIDWDTQREIALIPNGDWDMGVERIAKRIKEIEARGAIKSLIAEFEAEFGQLDVAPGIGHNHPPEPLRQIGTENASEALTIVFDIKQEVSSPEPSPERAERLGTRLVTVVKAGGLLAIGGYLAASGEQIGNAVNPRLLDLLRAIAETTLRWAEALARLL